MKFDLIFDVTQRHPITWVPGANVWNLAMRKGQCPLDWEFYWDRDVGTFFVPHAELRPEVFTQELQEKVKEGAVFDPNTLPPWMTTQGFQVPISTAGTGIKSVEAQGSMSVQLIFLVYVFFCEPAICSQRVYL